MNETKNAVENFKMAQEYETCQKKTLNDSFFFFNWYEVPMVTFTSCSNANLLIKCNYYNKL